VVSGGLLAAYLDQQKDPTPITPGRGALTGFLAGMIGVVVWLIVASAVNAVMTPLLGPFGGGMSRAPVEMPPEARRVFDWLIANPSLLIAFEFVARLFGNAIFATLGGLLGAAFFRSDVPPALGGPIAPPPLPPQ
jgi:hypothetical protein